MCAHGEIGKKYLADDQLTKGDPFKDALDFNDSSKTRHLSTD